MGSTTHRMDSPNRRGEHAVVLGAGVAGLLAARVLSEFHDSVSVVERDGLPDYPFHRRGIPQGRHLHNFHSRGLQVLGELFPDCSMNSPGPARSSSTTAIWRISTCVSGGTS